jgi:phospholipase A2
VGKVIDNCKERLHPHHPLSAEAIRKLLTAIRYERPWKDWEDKDQPFKEPDQSAIEHQTVSDAWFQWFEMTPFEVGCDELEAWVPTWGFGRPFSQGRSTLQLPQPSLSLLLGLATGTPARPLSSYISTIKRQLPPDVMGDAISDIASKVTYFWGKQGIESF